MITKIRSGGQTGADFGAILGARDVNIPTGGWAPKGWWTESGPNPALAKFSLVEHPQSGYPARTGANVRDSDGTLIFGRAYSPGCLLTQQYAREYKKPLLIVAWPHEPGRIDTVLEWLASNDVRELNVAGNRESRNPGIQEACRVFIRTLLGSR